MEFEDKRVERRLNKEIPVSFATLSRIDVHPIEFGNSVTIDVSSKGCSLMVDEPVAVPMLIQIKLEIPEEARELVFVGRSIYCSRIQAQDLYRVGIRFVGVLPVDLTTFVSED